MKSALLYAAMVTTAMFATPSAFAAANEEGRTSLSMHQKSSCSKKTERPSSVGMTELEELESALGVELVPAGLLAGPGIDTCPMCYVVFGNTIYYIAGCLCA